MSIIGSNILAGASGQAAGGYEIEQSLRFNSADSAYLSRTPGSAGNTQKMTMSVWVKRTALASTNTDTGTKTIFGAATTGNRDQIRFEHDASGRGDQFSLFLLNDAATANECFLSTAARFRDAAGWYHLVIAIDTTQGTAANRVKFYVNGTQITDFEANTQPGQDFTINYFNNTVAHQIGRDPSGSEQLFDGYMSDFNWIDGQQLDASSFGELDDNGVWRPIKYAGSYTGNSFYLKFDAADVDGDSSGLGNDWTASAGISTSGTGTDVMSDTPTTNWCTLNPLDAAANNGIADGNLKCGTTTAANTTSIRATQAVSSGKWYFEVQKITTGTINIQCGWAATNLAHTFDTGDTGVYGKAISGTTVMIAADFDNNAIWTGVDGTWDNSATTAEIEAGTTTNAAHTGVANYPLAPMFLDQAGSFSGEANFNFGQRDFAYTPPTGFNALNTANLPAPDIADPSLWFDVKTHVGYTVGAWFTLGQNFDIDFIWTKNRTGAYNHVLVDSVRGDNNSLASNTTASENTAAGVLLGTGANSKQVYFNGSVNEISNAGQTYVDWLWKEGAVPGFDIVTYTGDGTTSANRLIDHNLGVTPDFIITKKRSSGTTDYGWSTWHKDLGGNYGVWLHLTNARNPSMWDGYTNFSSTKFTPPDLNYGNENTQTYVNYLWAEVPGFSRIGKYIGNGNADGPCVWCGFKPAFVMAKLATTSGWWVMVDSARNSYNVVDDELVANGSYAENGLAITTAVDFTANGFKIRTSDANWNSNTQTLIFVAFAENPFGGSGISPATAR